MNACMHNDPQEQNTTTLNNKSSDWDECGAGERDNTGGSYHARLCCGGPSRADALSSCLNSAGSLFVLLLQERCSPLVERKLHAYEKFWMYHCRVQWIKRQRSMCGRLKSQTETRIWKIVKLQAEVGGFERNGIKIWAEKESRKKKENKKTDAIVRSERLHRIDLIFSFLNI